MKFLNTPCRLGQRMFNNWSEALDAYFAGELNDSDIGCVANYYAEIEKEWSKNNVRNNRNNRPRI